jgi:hypothetical protein
MKFINKIIQANRSGAKAKIIDENKNYVIVEYLTSFEGVYKYPKEAISKYWSFIN